MTVIDGKANATAITGEEKVFETKDYLVRRLPTPGLVSRVEATGTLPAAPGRRCIRPRTTGSDTTAATTFMPRESGHPRWRLQQRCRWRKPTTLSHAPRWARALPSGVPPCASQIRPGG